SDFSKAPLSSLDPVRRLSAIAFLTPTEYRRIKAAAEGSADFDALVAASASAVEARRAARDKLETLGIENIDDLPRIWATDRLSDEELRKFADCVSSRQPGLEVFGRSERPDRFHLTFTHITPIGIEKIATRLVASSNIGNAKEFEAYLAELGPQDNYTARTFPLKIVDPKRPSVVVMRAGWETPRIVHIPVYPTPDYFKRGEQ
ncbi:MAG: hypothetical protein K2Q06_04835, partial [Parvularculaceae bacterium]|nr:hypothetical protein [Parvularculaceae bacterium]